MKVAWSTKLKQSVMAIDYDQTEHGMVQCIDADCRVSVIHNRGNQDITPHFKTTGHADSQHKPECGFFQKLDPLEALEKTIEYQTLMEATVPFVSKRSNMHSPPSSAALSRIDVKPLPPLPCSCTQSGVPRLSDAVCQFIAKCQNSRF